MKMMTKEEITTASQTILFKIQRLGFICLVLILLGACVGAYGMRVYQTSNVKDWIKMQCFMDENGHVYKVEYDPVKNK